MSDHIVRLAIKKKSYRWRAIAARVIGDKASLHPGEYVVRLRLNIPDSFFVSKIIDVTIDDDDVTVEQEK